MKEKNIKDLEVNGNWEKLHHGFIKGRSYQTNLISFLDKIIVPEKSNAVDLIYLDRNKALYCSLWEVIEGGEDEL